MKLAFASTTFGKDLPGEYQGSHRPEEPLDVMYASSAARAYSLSCIVDVWATQDFSAYDAVILSTTNSYLQWNNHPLGLDLVKAAFAQIRAKGGHRLPIVIFGPHVPAHHQELYEMGADAVFLGEAELSVGQASAALIRGESPSHLPGYVARGAVTLPMPAKIENLSSLPTPDWESIMSRDYWAHNHPVDGLSGHLYETSRGCPFFCSFCNTITHRRKYRTKSRAVIERDLKHLSKISSKRYVYFIDESFSADAEWIAEVAPVMKATGFQYGCQGNLKFLTREKIKLLADAGFISMEFGFETANDDLLKKVGKDNQIELAADLLNAACDAGISPLLFTLVGLPGESADTLMRTLAFFETLDPRVRISIGMPTPYIGTRLYKQGVKEGVIDPLAVGARLYAYTGRIGHQLDFTDSEKKAFLNTWGPNNFLTKENIAKLRDHLGRLFKAKAAQEAV